MLLSQDLSAVVKPAPEGARLGAIATVAERLGERLLVRGADDEDRVALCDPALLEQILDLVFLPRAEIQLLDHQMGYELGLQAGAWAKEHLSPGQTLKFGVLNYRVLPQVVEREKGIIDGIKAVFGDNLEIVASEQAGDPGQALPIAERWLRTYPELKMIVGINDAAAASI